MKAHASAVTAVTMCARQQPRGIPSHSLLEGSVRAATQRTTCSRRHPAKHQTPCKKSVWFCFVLCGRLLTRRCERCVHNKHRVQAYNIQRGHSRHLQDGIIKSPYDDNLTVCHNQSKSKTTQNNRHQPKIERKHQLSRTPKCHETAVGHLKLEQCIVTSIQAVSMHHLSVCTTITTGCQGTKCSA